MSAAMSLRSILSKGTPRSFICSQCLRQLRYSSTADSPPPLLSKIREDMKTAMRNKDKERLAVIRAIISETNQLASGPNAIKTDMQVLALLKKRKAASQTAAKEAEDVKRDDLKQKQEKEIEILDEYAGTIQLVPEAELRRLVTDLVTSLGKDRPANANPGFIFRTLLKGGPLEGKPVDKDQLAAIAKEIIEGTSVPRE